MISSAPPTIRLLAELCAVSRSTVSLALKRDPRISSRVIALVTETAVRIGYSPDPKVSDVMSRIARKDKGPRNRLAVLLSAQFNRPDPWREFPWFARVYEAIEQRADEYGYGVDPFWLGSPGMTGRRMKQILLARGIDGIIVPEHLQSPSDLEFDFSTFAASAIGHSLIRSRLDVVSTNLHDDLSNALNAVWERGYQRVGLALPRRSCTSALQGWKSCYYYQQSLASEGMRVPACVYDRTDLADLHDWYRTYQPDAILGLSWSTLTDLEMLGLRVPDEAGFVTLLQDNQRRSVSGIALQYRAIAARAVDLVIEKLRRFEKGLPAIPELILYDGAWVEGASAPARLASISAA